MVEDGLMELPQLRARLDAELLDEHLGALRYAVSASAWRPLR